MSTATICILHRKHLGSSHFARHYSGNLIFDFFSSATKIFQFTECPLTLEQYGFTVLGSPIRKSWSHNASWQLLQAFRTPCASFFGWSSQGIHFMLYVNLYSHFWWYSFVLFQIFNSSCIYEWIVFLFRDIIFSLVFLVNVRDLFLRKNRIKKEEKYENFSDFFLL